MSRTPTYKAWERMWRRVRHDPRYLAKGIKVSDRWQDFQNFYDDLGPRPDGRLVSLDRIDNDGDYEPGNVRWSTPPQQNNNKGNVVLITSERFGTRPQQEWLAILWEHTGDFTWDARKLKNALGIFRTLDALLEWLKIADLNAKCAALDVIDADQFVPA